jgi:hypothetical protein
MLDVGNGKQQHPEYFKALLEQMDNGGREALLHYLMTYDLSQFEVRNVPKTAALREQQKRTLGQEAEWWYNKLREGRVLPEHESWVQEVQKDQVLDDYIHLARRLNYTRRGNSTTLGLFLSRVCPGLQTFQQWATVERETGDGYVHKVERRVYFYTLPTLEECRARWTELYGAEEWPVPIGQLTQQAPLKQPF